MVRIRMWRYGFYSVVASTGLSLAIMILVPWIFGYDPREVIGAGFGYALLSRRGLYSVIANATPLLATSAAWIVGVRTGVFNIGVEGAVQVAAIAALTCGAFVKLPSGFHHVVVCASALGAGALWMLPVAYLKRKWNVHEVLATIMLNWVGLFAVGATVSTFLRDSQWPMFSVQILPSARVLPLFGGSNVTILSPLSLLICLAVYFVFWHTRLGMHLRATGYDMSTARNLGIRTVKMQSMAFMSAGALAGFAGFVLTSGMPPMWRITDSAEILTNWGYLGIAVSVLSRNHPLVTPFGAFFIAMLLAAARGLQIYLKLPPEITQVVVGLIIFINAAPAFAGIVQKALLAVSGPSTSSREEGDRGE
ncbi:ABC transporter permease [uncultured Thermanaerothrix sp.]|uniref:ABC transporter permease n=1 Tax=uncultured Thermanaerothrix sp. TaxID=1195149 RepID=UPI00262888BE|nr:ABC transporter permease [uncultured Thermanaerothrix sp.]